MSQKAVVFRGGGSPNHVTVKGSWRTKAREVQMRKKLMVDIKDIQAGKV